MINHLVAHTQNKGVRPSQRQLKSVRRPKWNDEHSSAHIPAPAQNQREQRVVQGGLHVRPEVVEGCRRVGSLVSLRPHSEDLFRHETVCTTSLRRRRDVRCGRLDRASSGSLLWKDCRSQSAHRRICLQRMHGTAHADLSSQSARRCSGQRTSGNFDIPVEPRGRSEPQFSKVSLFHVHKSASIGPGTFFSSFFVSPAGFHRLSSWPR